MDSAQGKDSPISISGLTPNMASAIVMSAKRVAAGAGIEIPKDTFVFETKKNTLTIRLDKNNPQHQLIIADIYNHVRKYYEERGVTISPADKGFNTQEDLEKDTVSRYDTFFEQSGFRLFVRRDSSKEIAPLPQVTKTPADHMLLYRGTGSIATKKYSNVLYE